jgi:hypothetical protein
VQRELCRENATSILPKRVRERETSGVQHPDNCSGLNYNITQGTNVPSHLLHARAKAHQYLKYGRLGIKVAQLLRLCGAGAFSHGYSSLLLMKRIMCGGVLAGVDEVNKGRAKKCRDGSCQELARNTYVRRVSDCDFE